MIGLGVFLSNYLYLKSSKYINPESLAEVPAFHVRAADPERLRNTLRLSPPYDYEHNCRYGMEISISASIQSKFPYETPKEYIGPQLQYFIYALRDALAALPAPAKSSAMKELSVSVTRMAFSSSHLITQGYWDIELSISNGSDPPLQVVDRYTFDVGFAPIPACNAVANALPRAVDAMARKIIAHPDLRTLL